MVLVYREISGNYLDLELFINRKIEVMVKLFFCNVLILLELSNIELSNCLFYDPCLSSQLLSHYKNKT